ncbi:TIR-like protein FxsC [Dactylosporangium sp. CS-033363]|uniref:TIR-like protein FxsC n=1 Tax=Dactylosporangium sp. CS-033363 TaxID=3239935 RepID=UPI003D8DE16A
MTVPGRDVYFFLSYARSSPVSDDVPNDPDYWVRKFFADVSAALEAHAERDPDLAGGFFDGLLRVGDDVGRAQADALAVAQVFVPLYSPLYFGNGWALGERESFATRLRTAGLDEDAIARHTVPVLWTPLPPWDSRPEIGQAIAAVADAPEMQGKTAAYEQNGLRVMSRLDAYAGEYAEIVGVLAARIVAAARAEPLPRAADPVRPAAPPQRGPGTRLVVSVLAPDAGVAWHPYAGHGHARPVAGYVAETAERLGVPTRVAELADIDKNAAEPVLVLVDGTADADAVRAGLAGLPAWAVPVVLPGTGGAEPRRAAIEAAPSGFTPVYQLDQLGRVVPVAVFQARNQYLKRLAHNWPPDERRLSLRKDAADQRRGTEEER